jgi:hypothetical protein
VYRKLGFGPYLQHALDDGVEPAGANVGHTRIDVARDPRYLAHRIIREDQLDALSAEQSFLRMSRERPMTNSGN